MQETEARTIVERAHLVATLREHPGWQALVVYVEDASRKKQQRLISGGCNTFEDYLKDTGWLAGADFVLSAHETTEQAARLARPALNKGA